MKKQVVAGIVAMWALTGCGPADAVLHGYHRYTDPSVAMEPTIRQNSVFNARPVGAWEVRSQAWGCRRVHHVRLG